MPKKLVLFDFFRTLYYSNHTIPDEVADIVKVLAQKYTLGIVSSMAKESILEILQNFGLGSFFVEISGGNLPKSERINAFRKRLDLKKKDIVLITDTIDDIEEANKSEIQVIGVTWGLHTKQMLQKGNPFKIVESPLDLINAVNAALG